MTTYIDVKGLGTLSPSTLADYARRHEIEGDTMEQRLLCAVLLMTEKLAEAHRAELDAVVERVKRLEAGTATHEAHVDLEARVTALEERASLLEEEARVLNASILDRREVAP